VKPGGYLDESVAHADHHGHARELLRQLAVTEVDDDRREPLRAKVIEAWLPYAHALARRYQRRGVPVEDLQQVAALALVKAVDGFDADLGWNFTGYATPTILGALRRYFRDQGWDVRVPRHLQELRQRLAQAGDALTQRLGRMPTVTDLAHAGAPTSSPTCRRVRWRTESGPCPPHRTASSYVQSITARRNQRSTFHHRCAVAPSGRTTVCSQSWLGGWSWRQPVPLGRLHPAVPDELPAWQRRPVTAIRMAVRWPVRTARSDGQHASDVEDFAHHGVGDEIRDAF
jgi:RNA polymerase sigma factor (sigma-70 family)